MDSLTIETFWKRRLSQAQRLPEHTLEAVSGWEYVNDPLDAFTEAPLSVLEQEHNVDLADSTSCPIIVVSAPGAVGKTTLARQIAHETDSIYVDLASAVVPAGNTITGALSKAGLLDESAKVALLIDALDEGRLKTTSEGFQDFFEDLSDVAKRGVTIVLFGRAPAADEAWVLLQDAGECAALLEIRYYDKTQSSEFAKNHLRSFLASKNRPVGQRHIDELQSLIHLVEESGTATDADRSYRGYAPVLQTVAELVANSDDDVHGTFGPEESASEEELLPKIVGWVLKREQEKFHASGLQDIAISDEILVDLYDAREQLDLLVARAYDVDAPEVDSRVEGDVRAEYVKNRDWWIANHPFVVEASSYSNVDPRERGSLVAKAVVDGWALRQEMARTAGDNGVREDVMRRAVEKLRYKKANPLLWSWYVYGMRDITGENRLPFHSSHLAVVYDSLVAQVESAAELFVGESEDGGLPDVELFIYGAGVDGNRRIAGVLLEADSLAFGGSLAGVYIELPETIVRIGDGNGVLLQGPVYISCGLLEIDARHAQVGRFGRVRGYGGPEEDWQTSVLLRAEACEATKVEQKPTVKGVVFEVSWPNSDLYPWSEFAIEEGASKAGPDIDVELERAKTALNQILRLFSRKGNWSRDRNASKYAKAVDKTARRNPLGERVLEQLKLEQLVLADGKSAFYELRLSELAAVMRMTREDFAGGEWTQGAEEFLNRALRKKK